MSDPATAAPPAEYARSIAPEALNALPIRRYEGPVRVVSDPADLPPVLDDLRQADVVGFDTETRPAFKVGESYPPSLVQFATANAVHLLQIRHAALHDAVREVLASAAIVKAGVSVSHDLRELKKVFPFDEAAVVDLGTVARRHRIQQTGVRNLAGIFLGLRIPKGAKTTNWAARELSPQQVAYAATDAWTCRELYLRFRALQML